MASLVPAVMPAPHWSTGASQVIVPPTFLQPWLVSSVVALATENGYGPCPQLEFSIAGVHGLAGWLGTPPAVG